MRVCLVSVAKRHTLFFVFSQLLFVFSQLLFYMNNLFCVGSCVFF